MSENFNTLAKRVTISSITLSDITENSSYNKQMKENQMSNKAVIVL